MNAKALISMAITTVVLTFFFQNCGQGFQSDLNEGSFSNSSSVVSDFTTGLSCENTTTFIKCAAGTELPTTYLENGCLALACEVESTVGAGSGAPACEYQYVECGPNETLGFDMVNGCAVGKCEASPANNQGSDVMSVEFLNRQGSQIQGVQVAGYPKSNVSAAQVQGLCQEAADFAHMNISQNVASVRCLHDGQAIATASLEMQKVVHYTTTDYSYGQSMTRPESKDYYTRLLNASGDGGTSFVIWGNQLISAINPGGQCMDGANLGGMLSYIDGLSSSSRAQFDSEIGLCQDNGGGSTSPGGQSCDVSTSLANSIDAIYQRLFGRSVRPDGLCYHANLFNSHRNLRQTEYDIIMAAQAEDVQRMKRSAELRNQIIDFTVAHNDRINTQLLTSSEQVVYGHFQKWFNRAPESAGLVYWAGQSMSDVALEHSLVSSASAKDQAYVRANRSSAFRNFCNSHGLAIPSWL